jgi:hypothetical protein
VLLPAALDALAVIGGLTASWSASLAALALLRGEDLDELQRQSVAGLAVGGLLGGLRETICETSGGRLHAMGRE